MRIEGSYLFSSAALTLVYSPLLSTAIVSAVVSAVRASSLAWASEALPFCPANAGMAIAARMPMMRITTSSSISEKPSSSLNSSETFANTMALRDVLLAVELSLHEIPDFAPPPHGEFAFFSLGLFGSRTVQHGPAEEKPLAGFAGEMDGCTSGRPQAQAAWRSSSTQAA